MIARELNSGKTAGGLIDYVFEGRYEHHKGEDKQAHILRASDNLVVPYNYQDKEGIKSLKEDFNQRTSDYLLKNPENKTKLVGHAILSFTDDDLLKLNGDTRKVLDDYIRLSGLDKTQYFTAGHIDTNNYHIHIVYNKVGDDGKLLDDWKSKNKAVERAVALTLKYKLNLPEKMAKVAKTKGVLEIRKRDEDIINLRNSNPLLKEAKNLYHLDRLAKLHNVKLDTVLSRDSTIMDNRVINNNDLNAVFYLNRHPNESNSIFLKMKDVQKEYNRIAKQVNRIANTDKLPKSDLQNDASGEITSPIRMPKGDQTPQNVKTRKKKKKYQIDYNKKAAKKTKSNTKSLGL